MIGLAVASAGPVTAGWRAVARPIPALRSMTVRPAPRRAPSRASTFAGYPVVTVPRCQIDPRYLRPTPWRSCSPSPGGTTSHDYKRKRCPSHRPCDVLPSAGAHRHAGKAFFHQPPQTTWFCCRHRHASEHRAFQDLGPFLGRKTLLVCHDNLLRLQIKPNCRVRGRAKARRPRQ